MVKTSLFFYKYKRTKPAQNQRGNPESLDNPTLNGEVCRQTHIYEDAMIERQEIGPRMSKIVKHNGTVYLCGQVGAGDTVTEQTQDCLARVDALLKQAGSSREQILQAIIWVADMADFDEMNAVWDAWVPEGHAPARACGEAKLARDALKVEVIVTAAYA